MEGAHLFDLPPEVIVKILMELDEQSLGLFKCVCRYVNSLIERHRTSLVRQTIYAAVFKEDELIVERYLKRNRWIENKYSISHSLLDPTIIRQLICADIATVKFQVNMPDELAIHLAHHISKFKLDVFRVCFVKCRLSIKAINELLLALKPQLVTIEFDENFNGITIKEFSKYDGFKEVHL
ncbi:F-box domain protein [Dictyocaulus viviparus]|uniref:F-box domain protein n=1 Tax=Dictyocaulus viviparus TaxID=29172 RepID=A0A0D8XKX0_DICVI|nr:F-box domain protein [Dictyocaulus viviparus]